MQLHLNTEAWQAHWRISKASENSRAVEVPLIMTKERLGIPTSSWNPSTHPQSLRTSLVETMSKSRSGLGTALDVAIKLGDPALPLWLNLGVPLHRSTIDGEKGNAGLLSSLGPAWQHCQVLPPVTLTGFACLKGVWIVSMPCLELQGWQLTVEERVRGFIKWKDKKMQASLDTSSQLQTERRKPSSF